MINVEKLISSLQALLQEGKNLGLSMKDFEDKLESVKQMMAGGKVRIALLGAFSDGKTSSIAAFLGCLSDDMKIDADESSDEITVYHPFEMEDKFEIIDTPGLFGSKEKEHNGEITKFSDITLKYLSEANIVIYVCDAKNPLKNSHRPVIYKVMRELNKLPVSIFVINKMDETGYDLTDDEEYADISKTKKDTLIRNVDDCLKLSEKEKRDLKICCIAADPKRAGLAYWLQRTKDYEMRSHIQSLRKEVKALTQTADTKKVIDNSFIASTKEIMGGIENAIDVVVNPIAESLKKCDESCADLKVDEVNLRNDLITAKNAAIYSLDNYKLSLLSEIKSASLETFQSILDTSIGVGKANVSFSVVEREINRRLEQLGERAISATESSQFAFERKFNDQEKFLKNAAGKGIKYLKNVKINGEQVKSVRNVLFKNHKFKPWGAIKMADKITKGIGLAAVGASTAIEVYQWWKEKKANEEMEDAKKTISGIIGEIFDNVNKSLSDSEFWISYGQGYLQMKKQLEERECQLAELKKQVEELNNYKQSIRDFWKSNAQDIEYQES